MPITAEELVALGWDTMVPDTINGRSNGDHRITFNHPDDTYGPCAEALADAPGGAIFEIEAWSKSVIYPESTRRVWCYKPSQWDDATPGKVLVCNDGAAYVANEGQ